MLRYFYIKNLVEYQFVTTNMIHISTVYKVVAILQYGAMLLRNNQNSSLTIMEGNYLTSGDLAMWDTARTSRAGNWYGGYGEGCGYGHGYHRNGTATTGVALGAAGLGIAIFGGLAVAYGLNSASKARARGAENAIAAQSKTMEFIAATVKREAVRQDGINIDVQQNMRNQAYTTAYGGGANATSNALATAEALAMLQNNNGTGLNSAVGGCNYLRVARVSGSRLCGCDGCGAE